MAGNKQEEFGINTINLYFEMNDYITIDGTIHDKIPNEDGAIYIYSNKQKKKDGVKKVLMQSKGDTSTYTDKTSSEMEKLLEKNKVKKQIDYAYFEYFRKYGGIYFVSFRLKNNERVLTYCTLYPNVCKKKMDHMNRKGTESASTVLKEFPKDLEEQRLLLLEIESNIRKQTSTVVDNYFYMHEIVNKGLLDSEEIVFSKSVISEGEMDFIDQLVMLTDPDKPLYLKHSQNPPAYLSMEPVDFMAIPDMKKIKVQSGKNNIFEGRVVVESGKAYIEVNGFFRVVFRGAKRQPDNMGFDLSKDLKVLRRQLTFLIDAINEGVIRFNDEYDLWLDKAGNEELLETAIDILSFVEKIENIEDNFGIDLSAFPLDKVDKYRFEIEVLNKMCVNTKQQLERDMLTGRIFKLGEYRIFTALSHEKDDLFKIIDVCRDFITITFEGIKIKTILAGFPENFFLSDNFIANKDQLIDSYKDILNSYKDEVKLKTTFIDYFRNGLLRNLLVYDEMDKTKEVKKYKEATAKFLFDMAKILWEYTDDNMDCLNFFQVKKRLGQLNSKDKERLRDIIGSSNDDMVIMGAYSLLGNRSKAQKILKEFDDDKKAFVKEFPIYRYIK